MKIYILIGFAFFTVMLTSCKNYEEITFSGIENVNVINLSRQGVEAIITAKIKNPNSVGFTIYKSEMDVTIGGINAGKARLAKNVRIKANSEESYSFKIKSDFSNLNISDMTKIMAMALKNRVTVGLKGDLKAGKLFIKRSFPFDIVKNVPLNGM